MGDSNTPPNQFRPNSQPPGWQQSAAFFQLYPTRAARRAFYEWRAAENDALKRGFNPRRTAFWSPKLTADMNVPTGPW